MIRDETTVHALKRGNICSGICLLDCDDGDGEEENSLEESASYRFQTLVVIHVLEIMIFREVLGT